MPKAVNIYFENAEIEKLVKVKGDKSWHDFVIDCCLIESEEKPDAN